MASAKELFDKPKLADCPIQEPITIVEIKRIGVMDRFGCVCVYLWYWSINWTILVQHNLCCSYIL